MKNLFCILTLLCSSSQLFSQAAPETEVEFTEEEMAAIIDSIESSLEYQYGRVEIVDGEAYLDVPENFKFLNGEQASYVLTDLWGNPPSDILPEGMLVPKDQGVINDDARYAIEITYSDEGYIEDDDAKDIDYDEMLKEMKSDSEATNEYRRENGYVTVDMVGWASEPYYDEHTKKLHWASELKFEGSEVNTLNYNIRVLGRKGFINLNAISQMDVFDEVKTAVPNVLSSVHFADGSTYADYTPGVDKVAVYGIGALVAGKVMAKAGLLAKAGIFLAKFWKFILLAVVSLGAFFKKMVFGEKREQKGPIS